MEVVDVDDLDDLDAVSGLLDEIWGRPVPMVGRDLLRALAHAGNQVSSALPREGGRRPVGGTVAFLGRHPSGAGAARVYLHSHITGVAATGQGVGFALKQHQRHWALARGIDEVRWTFDPLVRRNAVFNLIKLGARIVGYVADMYGAVEDDINAGEPTDRAVVSWPLSSGRAVACSQRRFAEPDAAGLRGAGAAVALDDEGGHPVEAEASGARLLVRVPADIEGMRAEDPRRAAAWQQAVRRRLGGALDAGYRTAGFTRDGFYVLVRNSGVSELAAGCG